MCDVAGSRTVISIGVFDSGSVIPNSHQDDGHDNDGDYQSGHGSFLFFVRFFSAQSATARFDRKFSLRAGVVPRCDPLSGGPLVGCSGRLNRYFQNFHHFLRS